MRATTHTMATVPPQLAHGQRFRQIVEAAVRQRRYLVKNRMSPAVELGRLVTWLERNPFPSERTVQGFPLMGDLAAAMPYHDAGKKMLAEARELTTYKPLNHR